MHCSLNDKPILTPKQMPKQIMAQPLTAKARAMRENSEKQAVYDYNDYIKLNSLEKKLQSFIPNSFINYKSDEYIEMEYKRGQFMYGDRARLEIGYPNQCHKNTIELYTLNPEISSIVTGWAWIQQDLWVQHSWLIHYLDEKHKTYEIVETTLKRNAYYGVILTPEEAQQFIRFCYN